MERFQKGYQLLITRYRERKFVEVSFAGESCRIVQISSQVFQIMNRNGAMKSEIEKETFDKYVWPGVPYSCVL